MLYLDECSFIASRFGQRWKNYSNIQNKLPVRKTLYQGKMKEDELESRPRSHFGVRCGARTHDNQNHNLVLYQLN